MNSVVVHYKELALKGKNRPWFVQILVRNLRRARTGFDVSSIRSVMGRIEIEFGGEPPWGDANPAPLARLVHQARFVRQAPSVREVPSARWIYPAPPFGPRHRSADAASAICLAPSGS